MNLSDDIKKKLAALNRRPLDDAKTSDVSQEQNDYRRSLQINGSPSQTPDFVSLEGTVAGGEVMSQDGCRVFLVEHRLNEMDTSLDGSRYAALSEKLSSTLSSFDSGIRSHLKRVGIADPVSPQDIIFLDLETTGLGTSPLFLIGVMIWEKSGLIIQQYFARDYSEERAAVSLFLQLASARRLLVSFNGKSFDLPYVRNRAVANGIPYSLDLPHLDLLHASRRVWKGKLPDCRLQTIEESICGRKRHGDIPGNLIPQAYHAFVRTGNAAQMVDVLQHNALDLITLADIMVRIPDCE